MTRLPHYEAFNRQIFDNIASEIDYSLEKRKKDAQKIIDSHPGTLDALMTRMNILGLMQAEGKLSEIKDEIDNIVLTGDNYVDFTILDLKYSIFQELNL